MRTRAHSTQHTLVILAHEVTAAQSRVTAKERAERQIAKTFGPAVAKYLRLSGRRLTDKLSRIESRINGLIEEAPRDRVLDAADSLMDEGLGEIEDNILRPSTLALSRGYEAGWKRALRMFREFGLDLSGDVFNVRNRAAVEWVARAGADLVKNINGQTKEIVRGLITDGVAEGKSYQKIAREIRQRFNADGTFSGRVPGPRHTRTRAELIAVTEIGNAYEQGTFEVAGRVHSTTPMEKRWITVGDERVSAMDRRNEAQGWISYTRNFSSGHERPLSHPGCRCTVIFRVRRRRRSSR